MVCSRAEPDLSRQTTTLLNAGTGRAFCSRKLGKMPSTVRYAAQLGQFLRCARCLDTQAWQKLWPQLVTNGSRSGDMQIGHAKSDSANSAGSARTGMAALVTTASPLASDFVAPLASRLPVASARSAPAWPALAVIRTPGHASVEGALG